jgi:two-component system, NarL family, response regulator LiaR
VSASRIRLVLAEDHAVVREGTAELLNRAGDIEVVGEAADGLEAVELVRRLHPQVLVVDIGLPGLDGVEVTRRVRGISAETAILALTARDEDPYILAMLEAGAHGYLTKAARARELIDAVRAVASGETVLAPEVAARVLRRALRPVLAPANPLTPREMEVLRAAARGLGNKQIGAELSLSPRTVQTHLTNIFTKLGVASRTEAVLRAIKEGWVEPS